MEFQAKLCFTFLGIICSSLLHLLYSRKLEGYEFPVYSTEFCPRNRSEWDQRSSAINCTEGNGYMCLPNESLTHLLEFCYIYPRLVISKDLCLFLIKRYSRVDSYNCSRFTHGCPTSTYFSSKIFEHPNCIHIENGCFWAEPTCQSSTISYAPKTTNSMPEETVQINSTTTFFQETKRYVEKTTLRREVQNDHNNDNYGWILVAVFLGKLKSVEETLMKKVVIKKNISLYVNINMMGQNPTKKIYWRPAYLAIGNRKTIILFQLRRAPR
ncbi:uncharacterized protein LOC128179443 isoform X7 [Crassostrea angulata]|uniref:uncharacterized protein LOC128179443 isoform X7 n=1 Tax=Magallana angulata TaxID=2784310 RepID=UPI0022B0F463|nr:uncharacterized protein LOC128179443 isoform X7 [Crassostrea angulata]